MSSFEFAAAPSAAFTAAADADAAYCSNSQLSILAECPDQASADGAHSRQAPPAPPARPPPVPQTLGPFVGFMLGWDMVLEYACAAATVAVGWSGYLCSLLKDLGNALEREIPERLRALRLRDPGSAAAGAYRVLLDDTVRDATSYTLRGGTPEVLRGMIARGLGLR